MGNDCILYDTDGKKVDEARDQELEKVIVLRRFSLTNNNQMFNMFLDATDAGRFLSNELYCSIPW